MLALLIFVVFSLTIYKLITAEITQEEVKQMLDSDEWY